MLMAQRGSFLVLCQEDLKFPECLRPGVCLLVSIAETVGVFLPGQLSHFSPIDFKSVRLRNGGLMKTVSGDVKGGDLAHDVVLKTKAV